tara:strand:- start:72 stop:287 length:216 start_codon:yes stop_codon:yes gene_type:complete
MSLETLFLMGFVTLITLATFSMFVKFAYQLTKDCLCDSDYLTVPFIWLVVLFAAFVFSSILWALYTQFLFL